MVLCSCLGFCGHDGLGQRAVPLIRSVLLVWRERLSTAWMWRFLAGNASNCWQVAWCPVHPAESAHKPLQSVYPLSQLYEMITWGQPRVSVLGAEYKPVSCLSYLLGFQRWHVHVARSLPHSAVQLSGPERQIAPCRHHLLQPQNSFISPAGNSAPFSQPPGSQVLFCELGKLRTPDKKTPASFCD